MAENIPVPAEVVRQMAIEASDEIRRHRDEGRPATARSIHESVSVALSKSRNKDGEFVSIDPSIVSELTAESASNPEIWQYTDAAEVFLEQYDIW
jgi:hypothetical protein